MKIKTSILISIVALAGCSKVPVTGRRQLNLLPQATLNSMALTEYRSFLSKNTVVAATDNQALLVKKVGQRIADAASTYLRTHGQAKRIAGYNWEFNLVQDATVNAWCMPGGKVVVYSGLLPVTMDETGLAVVLGHEISHAIANHGNERMSQQMGVSLGQTALDIALSQKPAETRNLFLQSYGVASTLGLLKYSRVDETEADHIGLIFMALAGYNPNDAVPFWERMAKTGGAQPPVFLSTHPSHETRIADIKKWMPEAMKYYKPTAQAKVAPQSNPPKTTKPTTPTKSGRN